MIQSSFVVIALLFLIPIILFLRFSKTKNTLGLATLLGAIHLFLVVLIAIFIYVGMKKEGEVAMVWLLFYMIDIPISLFLPFLDSLVTSVIGNNFMISNFYVPFVYFILFGSAQYFLIGTGIGWLYNRIKKN